MSTPESKVKYFIVARMKKWFPDAIKYCPPGNRFGRSGMPDFLYFIKADERTVIVAAIEAKADDQNLTTLQANMLVKFMTQGAIALVIRGKDEQKMMMLKNEILRRIRMANEIL